MMSTPLKIVDDKVVAAEEEDAPAVEETEAEEVSVEDEPKELGLEIQTLMDDRSQYIQDKVGEWMSFYAGIGATKLCLDEFPLPITHKDSLRIIDWLTNTKGFTITKKWYFGKTWIHMDKRLGVHTT